MLKVSFDKKDVRRIQFAIGNIKQEVNIKLIKNGGSFNKLCAIDYVQLLIRNIFSRKSPSPPYSKKYAEWKKKKSLRGYPSPWQLTGSLVESLTSFRQAKGWGGGIPSGVFCSGLLIRKEEIAYYARKEEARRPVFLPTMKEYRAGGMIKRAGEMMNKISMKWR